jgi:hypothetical protein
MLLATCTMPLIRDDVGPAEVFSTRFNEDAPISMRTDTGHSVCYRLSRTTAVIHQSRLVATSGRFQCLRAGRLILKAEQAQLKSGFSCSLMTEWSKSLCDNRSECSNPF